MKQKLKTILRVLFKIFLVLFALACVLLIYFNIPVLHENVDAKLGVTFSSRYATDIGLDWRAAYLATLDDLGVKKIRIPVYWDLVEPQKGQYDFTDLDWQLAEAEKRQAEIILVVGQKVPRWPECFIPEYLKNDDAARKEELITFIQAVVARYKENSAIRYWQVENEPFLKFGECPALDTSLLDREIATVKEVDPTRQIVVTDSGELSLWTQAEKRADVFGTTMYRTIYSAKYNSFYTYPIGPRFFQFKYWMNRLLVGQKNAIVIELQGEPWINGWTTSQPLEAQFQSMNAQRLADNVHFARQVGFPEIYIWGVEWWYWLKTTQNHPEVWDMAKSMFQNQ